MTNIIKQKISFEEVSRLCHALAEKVEKNGFKPDLIVGISRGGWVPASLVSDFLNVGFVVSVGVKSYAAVGVKKQPIIRENLGMDIQNMNVLVVDDIVDTGETLKLIKDHLEDLGASEIKSVVMHLKPWAKIKPDYFVEETTNWPVYPWESAEDERKL
ncbi:MAG: phosphoribosyltransferase [Nanoarchaeota archaeon]|nr:phosphoribosyltransferase [Nanoarchaeota archaeon]MBU2440760.1 phosphoribosyltransferase [Nanoarchaeota archaeon]